jgi:hypothetical protein
VYHALRIGPAATRGLRAEQEELSRRPGTQQVIERWEELESQVEQRHSAAKRSTGLVWLVVTVGALVGWYRIT